MNRWLVIAIAASASCRGSQPEPHWSAKPLKPYQSVAQGVAFSIELTEGMESHEFVANGAQTVTFMFPFDPDEAPFANVELVKPQTVQEFVDDFESVRKKYANLRKDALPDGFIVTYETNDVVRKRSRFRSTCSRRVDDQRALQVAVEVTPINDGDRTHVPEIEKMCLSLKPAAAPATPNGG